MLTLTLTARELIAKRSLLQATIFKNGLGRQKWRAPVYRQRVVPIRLKLSPASNVIASTRYTDPQLLAEAVAARRSSGLRP